MEEQVKDQVHEPSVVGDPTILLLGDFPDRLPASLSRWGLRCRTLDGPEIRRLSRPDQRAQLLEGISAIVVDGTVSRAATALRAARESGVPSILVRAERFLLGEADAGVVFSGWPGVEEIRRKVNQLIACPVPDRSTPIPTEPYLNFLQRRFGLVFPPRRSGEVKTAVRSRMTALRLPTSETYLERLQRSDTGDREPDHLLESLLVGETYLNRTPAHFETLRFQKLPELLERRPDRTLRAWSAGCSSGEEAYYLAATLRQIVPLPQIEVLGTDVNRKALEVGRRGRYARYSLREALPISMESCFRVDEEGVEVDSSLRSRVRFEYLNLLTWATGAVEGPQEAFDVIFCRNVLLYFSHTSARKVLQAMAQRLRPGGALFLGPSETVLSGATDLQVRAGLECFYLERPASDRADNRTPQIRRAPVTRTPAPHRIEDGAQEVPRMAAPPWQRTREQQSTHAAAGTPEAQVELGFRLLDEEDFEQAKKIFEAARKAESKADGPRLGLLFLEANAGRYELARAGCRVLAEEGSLRPELFYLLGLLHDQAGEAAPAERQFHRALFLDATFYMARFRLAEIHHRRGQQAKAAREAQNLLEQLRKLEPGDLVPLSGGMAREALEALCLGLVSADDGAKR